jgi:hypothetical protein
MTGAEHDRPTPARGPAREGVLRDARPAAAPAGARDHAPRPGPDEPCVARLPTVRRAGDVGPIRSLNGATER